MLQIKIKPTVSIITSSTINKRTVPKLVKVLTVNDLRIIANALRTKY